MSFHNFKYWKLIAVYMALVYLMFIAIIKYDKHAVDEDNVSASHSTKKE